MLKYLTLAIGSVSAFLNKDPYAGEELTVNPNEKQLYHTAMLDHFDSTETRTFQQRYWVDESDWDKANSAPVFLYLCGEWTCKGPSLKSAPFELAKELKGRYMSLEHRYYGLSQPFTDAQGGWSYENLKWQNVTQALADINHFIEDQNKKMNLTKSPDWVVIGGSYPGALSAWFKSKYPLAAKAAWSSSGVIHVIKDFYQNDMDVLLTSNISGPECPRIIA